MAHGWSLKWLHRQIVTSEAYRRSTTVLSKGDTAMDVAVAKDPANTLLWRQNLRRLEAEVIRESIRSAVGDERPRPHGALFASGAPIARQADDHLIGFGER